MCAILNEPNKYWTIIYVIKLENDAVVSLKMFTVPGTRPPSPQLTLTAHHDGSP